MSESTELSGLLDERDAVKSKRLSTFEENTGVYYERNLKTMLSLWQKGDAALHSTLTIPTIRKEKEAKNNMQHLRCAPMYTKEFNLCFLLG